MIQDFYFVYRSMQTDWRTETLNDLFLINSKYIIDLKNIEKSIKVEWIDEIFALNIFWRKE